MLWILLGLGFWIVCGALTYGITLAYFDGKFPGLGSNRGVASCMAFGGPIALAIAFVLSAFAKYGLKFRSAENG